MLRVLGASLSSILWLFGKEFTRLLMLAFAIAAPLAWCVMQNWLENFVFRIEIGLGVFALAILATFLVAIPVPASCLGQFGGLAAQ